jgi:hypothetical protein
MARGGQLGHDRAADGAGAAGDHGHPPAGLCSHERLTAFPMTGYRIAAAARPGSEAAGAL